MSYEVVGNLVSIGIPGSPSSTVLNFTSVDSISAQASEGSGIIQNDSLMGVRLQLLQNSALYIALKAAFDGGSNLTFNVTSPDGSTASFVGDLREWLVQTQPNQTTTEPVLVSFVIHVSDDSP